MRVIVTATNREGERWEEEVELPEAPTDEQIWELVDSRVERIQAELGGRYSVQVGWVQLGGPG